MTEPTVISFARAESHFHPIRAFLTKLFISALVLHGFVFQNAGAEFDEKQMKALYLYNFAKFTKFSAPPGNDSNSQIIVGIYGEIEFTSALPLIDGKKVARKSVIVKNFPSLEEAKEHCQILFIGEVEEGYLEVLKRLQGSSILTVSDAKNFARRGGMIEMYLESNIRKKQKLVFDVNLSSLKDENLSLNSRVLKLANKRIR